MPTSNVATLRSPATTWPVVESHGATCVTLTASRAMARPSPSVRRPSVFARTPDCCTLSGLMKSALDAKLSI